MQNIRYTDITRALSEKVPGFQRVPSRKLKTDGWNAVDLNIYSHAGTHMDAPPHFEVNETGIDEIPLHRLFCNCHIVRLPETRDRDILTPDSLGTIAEKFKEGEGLLFHTGWSRYFSNMEKYRNHLPRIGKELAIWCVDKKVNLVGVEPPSVADVNDLAELQGIHRIFLEAGILILEGICNLESVEKDYVRLVSLPLRIKGGDGSPARAVVLEDLSQ